VKAKQVPSASREDLREQVVAGLPVRDRRLVAAGVSTGVLEGGDGTPVVLLHEQGEFAARWMGIIPDLVRTHRVVAPDLPGHGATGLPDGPFDTEWMLSWLGELIDQTCDRPPILVGHMAAGALAARFAVRSHDRLAGLVLVDTFGLRRLRPAPRLLLALIRYGARPTARSYERVLRSCTVDFDEIRTGMGTRWEPFEGYVLDRARGPALKAALPAFVKTLGLRAIPPAELRQISVPTTLIWGRHDPATPLRVAETASSRYGWPLQVIEAAGDDPVLEQPDAVVRALRRAFASATAGASDER